MAASTASAASGATMATSLPSLATYKGSRPSSSQAASTWGLTGMAASCKRMPTPDWLAISFSVVARPPRVGSRSTRTAPGAAASRLATRVCSAAVSLSMVVSNASDSRCDSTATPWSPMVPDSRITSPTRALRPLTDTPGGSTPTPVVLMNTPSPLPFSTTLVSPVTTGTPASRAAWPIDFTMRCRSASAKPSSMMKLALRYSGTAPSMATSLTVPCTDRQPMSPPGKNSGEITWPSVAITRRPPAGSNAGSGSAAPSSPWRRKGLSRAGRNSSSISCAPALPPAPWPMSMRPCLMSSGRV